MKTGLFPILIPLHECPETHRLVGIYVNHRQILAFFRYQK
jgi:hypothetical protein